ncbi:hypothetical protein BDQ17DRAFT_1432437 [Cyathus striatus]|nr:hypothetical protein BDQ17DRAFT_1432437 [Cyathus striatus]
MKGAFQALKTLRIHSQNAKNCMAVLEIMESSPVNMLEIVFREIETAKAWKNLFLAIHHQHCDHAKIKALFFTDGNIHNLDELVQVPTAIRYTIYYEDFKTLLAFHNLTSIQFSPKYGFYFYDRNMTKEMATSWKSIVKLYLATRLPRWSPRQKTSKITLLGLLPFAEHCPDLTQLFISVDVTSPPKFCTYNIENKICQMALCSLFIENSPIEDPYHVAVFLTATFPHLCHIEYCHLRTCRNDDERRDSEVNEWT